MNTLDLILRNPEKLNGYPWRFLHVKEVKLGKKLFLSRNSVVFVRNLWSIEIVNTAIEIESRRRNAKNIITIMRHAKRR